MLETLATWFVDGGWGSLGVIAWLPLGLPIGLAAFIAALGKWRTAVALGATCLVLAICMLASGAIGVYGARAKTEAAYGTEMLDPSIRLRLLQASHEESKGCAKLALVLSLPLLLAGGLALHRGRRTGSDDAGPRKRKLQRVASSAILAATAIGFGGNLVLVLVKGGEEVARYEQLHP